MLLDLGFFFSLRNRAIFKLINWHEDGTVVVCIGVLFPFVYIIYMAMIGQYGNIFHRVFDFSFKYGLSEKKLFYFPKDLTKK